MGNIAAAILLTAGLVLAQGGGGVHQEDLAPPGEMAPEREEPEREAPAPVEAEPAQEDEDETPGPPEEPERSGEPETRPQPRSQGQRSVPAFWFVLPN
ncbi:MAG: hypothetical protein ACLFV4_00200 [Candidatus Hydrogenedentota bacterium]